jgi:hypothetical protein
MDTQLKTPFTPFQMQMLKLTERIKSQEEMDDIRELVSKYFAEKAQQEVDRLWELGVINDEVIESWKHEHMRTPYRSNGL